MDVRLVRDDVAAARQKKSVLAIDIGGTSVKLLASGQSERRRFPSGPKMTPDKMVKTSIKLVSDWTYSVISIGYPGPVLHGRPVSEPYNLGPGWVGFNFGTVVCGSVRYREQRGHVPRWSGGKCWGRHQHGFCGGAFG